MIWACKNFFSFVEGIIRAACSIELFQSCQGHSMKSVWIKAYCRFVQVQNLKNELRYIKIIMIYIAWVTCKISRLQVTLTNRNFFVFEELTCAYLHQVALSILLLPVQNYLTVVTELTRVQFAISTCKFFKDVNIAWVCRAVKILSYPSLYLMYIVILNFLNKPFEICFVFVF